MRVFFSPLDWGLGHASRCIPLIRYLLEKNIEVIIGTEGSHKVFLKEYFPAIEYIDFPGYRISYSKTIPAGVKIMVQLPKLISTICKEHELLDALIPEKKIDAVISDNRYGLWNKKIPSVIISHQLNILAPLGNGLLSAMVQKHIGKFDECWIPDYEGRDNLSGALSHPIPKVINGKYIGALSRFVSPTGFIKKKQYDLLVMLSGPEPQRSKLEQLVLKQLKELPSIKAFVIQGLPGNTKRENNITNVEIVPHLSDKEFENALSNSEVILSRPGYSTIMDLHVIGNTKSLFIPTPGQTEQEYLGKLMEQKELAITFKQQGFSLKEAMGKASKLNPVQPAYHKETYKEILDNWIAKIS